MDHLLYIIYICIVGIYKASVWEVHNLSQTLKRRQEDRWYLSNRLRRGLCVRMLSGNPLVCQWEEIIAAVQVQRIVCDKVNNHHIINYIICDQSTGLNRWCQSICARTSITTEYSPFLCSLLFNTRRLRRLRRGPTLCPIHQQTSVGTESSRWPPKAFQREIIIIIIIIILTTHNA